MLQLHCISKPMTKRHNMNHIRKFQNKSDNGDIFRCYSGVSRKQRNVVTKRLKVSETF